MLLEKFCGCRAILKAHGSDEVNVAVKQSSYQNMINTLVGRKKIRCFLDFHNLKHTRPEIVNIGTVGGEILQTPEKKKRFNAFLECFDRHKIPTSIDIPFNGRGTLAHRVGGGNIFALQLEINSIIEHRKNQKLLNSVINALVDFIKLYNDHRDLDLPGRDRI